MGVVSARQESAGGDGFGKKRSIAAATNGKKVIATGGSITTSGVYTIHTFTSTGNFVVESAPEGGVVVEYLIVGGGGGGGAGSDAVIVGAGGGGAGGFRTSVPGTTSGGGSPSNIETQFIAQRGRTYTITVGAGGAGDTDGTNSSISNPVQGSITAFGGGRGGYITGSANRNIYNVGQQSGTHSSGISRVSVAHGADNPSPTQVVHLFSAASGGHGGSGGGGGGGPTNGSMTGLNFRGVSVGGMGFGYAPTVYASQGYPGGDARGAQGDGGGGGGAGSAGANGWSATPTLPGGAPAAATGLGGSGLASSISGSSVTYAGGGSRGTSSGTVIGPAPGGGGAGAQAQPGIAAQAGGVNLGGGGGGGAWNNPGGPRPGASGGSGIVILRYIA